MQKRHRRQGEAVKTCAVCEDIVRNPQFHKAHPDPNTSRKLIICWKCTAADTAVPDLVSAFLKAKFELAQAGKVSRLYFYWENDWTGPGET
jgi:hypothetical protein